MKVKLQNTGRAWIVGNFIQAACVSDWYNERRRPMRQIKLSRIGNTFMIRSSALCLGFILTVNATAQSPQLPELGDNLTDQQVTSFAHLALKGLDQEYPNKPSNVIADASGVLSPREMHPAFYGCFDWHSSVHGHWMLVRLIRLYPEHELSDQIRQVLETHLTNENLEKETEYFAAKHNRSFERMYGWAWFFRLVTELHEWDDPQ